MISSCRQNVHKTLGTAENAEIAEIVRSSCELGRNLDVSDVVTDLGAVQRDIVH